MPPCCTSNADNSSVLTPYHPSFSKLPREEGWGDEAEKAEPDAPQATLEQRHQAAGDVLALRRHGFVAAGALFSIASHIPVETAP